MQGRWTQACLALAGVGAVVACAAALLLDASASRAATSDLVYKISKLKPLPAGKQVSAKANCPDDTSVVGGGLEIDEGNTATGMHSSLPFDDGDGNRVPDDGWLGVANSRSAGDKAMLTFAICSRSGKFSYLASAPQVEPNNSKLVAEARCPAGQSVAGGGLSLTQGGAETFYTAAGTYPIDLPSDPDAITDDGWRAAANNQSGIDQALTAYAICAKAGSYRYPQVKGNAPVGAQTDRQVQCPKGTSLTAGGVSARTPDLSAEVAAALPVDGGDGDMERNDAWLGAINNNSTATAGIGVYAVCRKHT